MSTAPYQEQESLERITGVSQDVFKAYMEKVKVVAREKANRCSVERLFAGLEAEKCREVKEIPVLQRRDYQKLLGKGSPHLQLQDCKSGDRCHGNQHLQRWRLGV
jgi:hypothetical protein